MKLFEMSEEDESIVIPGNVRVLSVLLGIIVLGVSLFFTRDVSFPIGLAVGLCVALLLFRQHELSIEKMLSTGNTGKGTADYIIRLLIRGAVIYAAARRSIPCAVGSILGLLSVPYSIYLLAFIQNHLIRKSGKRGEKDH